MRLDHQMQLFFSLDYIVNRFGLQRFNIYINIK